MRKQWLVLLMAVVASVTLWGCGSSGSGGSEVTAPAELADAADAGNCTICHTVQVHTELDGIAGSHPDYPDAITASNYLGVDIAHDCEACHGGGQFHHGDGPIPYPSPNGERCAACHDQATLVLASKHNAEDPENVDMIADGHDTRYCQRCHTAEGAVAFKEINGDYAYLRATIVSYGDPVGAGQVEALQAEDFDGNPILHGPACGACHNPLTKQLVQFDPANWDPNQNGESDQFDMCTACHNYKTADGSQLFGSGTVDSGTAKFYHYSAWYRTIATTHYDDPTTGYGLAENIVEGYVIRENSENPCFDCHGHELYTNTRYADTTEEDEDATSSIHTQWAQSGHAAGLLTAKYAVSRTDGVNNDRSDTLTDAVMAAGGSDDTSGGGFTHYDWDAANRQSCQMCHTSTGFVNYVADPENYDAADNDFSHLSGWTAGGNSGQNELLYCWGCHTDAESGALRVAGAVTATYTYNDEAVVFPDVGNSNTCVVCHSGRGNNETVSTSSRFAGHHAPAAADLFSEYSHVAYEYPGLSYENVPYFAHDGIDAEAAGPCVACHMNGDAEHTFEVVAKDDMGAITAIKADVCVSCHDGEHALFVGEGQIGTTQAIWNGTAAVDTVVTQAMVDEAAAVMEEEAEGYQEAGVVLNALLSNTIANYQGALINNSSTVENDLGAFQNAKLPTDEPGGFAHNRYYVKRALFDAIDWVEDGVINGTIADYSATYPEAAHWLGAARP